MKYPLLLALFILAFATHARAQLTWELMDSTTTALCFHNYGDTLLCGGPAGVFRYDEMADRWKNMAQIGSVRQFGTIGDVLFAGSESGVYRSTDRGVNWRRMRQGGDRDAVNALDIHGETIIAATNGHGMFRSTDRGETWAANNAGIDNAASAIFLSLGRIGGSIFASYHNDSPAIDRAYRSIDDGRIWSRTQYNWTDLSLLTFESYGSRLLAGMGDISGVLNAGIVYTDDLGETWMVAGVGLQRVWDILVDRSTLYAAGSPSVTTPIEFQGIYLSTDNGTTWEVSNNGMGTDPRSFQALGIDGAQLFAAVSGHGIYRTQIPPAGVETDKSSETGKSSEKIAFTLDCAPNPAHGEFFAKILLPVGRRIQLALFDSRGNRVATIADALFEAGEHRFTIPTTNLAPGVYFCRARSGEISVTTPIAVE